MKLPDDKDPAVSPIVLFLSVCVSKESCSLFMRYLVFYAFFFSSSSFFFSSSVFERKFATSS